MPVVTLPLKNTASSIAASWRALKDYSKTRLVPRSTDDRTRDHDLEEMDPYLDTSSWATEHKQLPQMPNNNGKITGLRTFVRYAYNSLATDNTPKSKTRTASDSDTYGTQGPIDVDDQDYHSQLKNLYTFGGNSPRTPNVAGSSFDVQLRSPSPCLKYTVSDKAGVLPAMYGG